MTNCLLQKGNSRKLLCIEFPAGIPENFLNSGGNYGEFIGVCFIYFLLLITTF